MARLPAPIAQRQVAADPVGGMAGTPDVSSHLVDFGNWLGAYAQKQQEKVDRVKVEEAYNELLIKQDDLTLGEKGFTQLKGKAVIDRDLMGEYGQQWDGSKAEITKKQGLSGRQQEMFETLALGARRQYNANLMRHQAKEIDAYDLQTLEQTVFLATEASTRDPTNREMVAAQRARIAHHVEEYWSDKGLDADGITQKKLEALSPLHLGRVNALLNNPTTENVSEARRILQEFGPEMTAADRKAAEAALKSGGTKAEAFAAFDAVSTLGLSEVEAKRRGKDLSPDARAYYNSLVDGHYADLKQAENEYEKDLLDRAWVFAKDATDISQVPGFDKLPGRQQTQIQDYIKGKNVERAKGPVIESVPEMLTQAMRGAAAGDVTEENLYMYEPFLTKKDMGALRKSITDADNVSTPDMMKAYRLANGISSDSKVYGDASAAKDFLAFQEFARSKIRSPYVTKKDLDSLAATWVMEGDALSEGTPQAPEDWGGFWGVNETFGEAYREGRAAGFKASTPEERVSEVDSAMGIVSSYDESYVPRMKSAEDARDYFYTQLWRPAEQRIASLVREGANVQVLIGPDGKPHTYAVQNTPDYQAAAVALMAYNHKARAKGEREYPLTTKNIAWYYANKIKPIQ